jgi:hypothetical protein
MLETGGVRGTVDPSWRIEVVMRRDTKQTRGRLAVYAECKEVHDLINRGTLMTVACREVAARRGKTQRSIEMLTKIMPRLCGERLASQ